MFAIFGLLLSLWYSRPNFSFVIEIHHEQNLLWHIDPCIVVILFVVHIEPGDHAIVLNARIHHVVRLIRPDGHRHFVDR